MSPHVVHRADPKVKLDTLMDTGYHFAFPFSAIPSQLTCYPLRLRPGQEIKSSLTQFVTGNGLDSPFVLSAVGSVTKATLRYADSTTIETLQGPFEIVSLVGTLSAGGHLHVALSDSSGRTFGGHVVGDMEVYTTAEIVIGNCDHVIFRREFDKDSGYNELVVSGRY